MTTLKPQFSTLLDVWIWANSMSGIYTVSSAYRWLHQQPAPPHQARGWSWIWKTKLPTNIQFFLWQLGHLSLPLPTRQTLSRRGIPCGNLCPTCGVMDESIVHYLFDCNVPAHLWSRFGVSATPVNDNDVLAWVKSQHKQGGVGIPILL